MRKSVDIVNHEAADDVLELVHSVMHTYRSLQYRFLRDGVHGITHMDGKVLGFFARHPGATQSDLAAHSGRDKAQLARLINGLREAGLLAAETDSADRRVTRLTLTAQGLAVQRELKAQGKRLSAQAVAGLSGAECRQLLGLLGRVHTNLESQI